MVLYFEKKNVLLLEKTTNTAMIYSPKHQLTKKHSLLRFFTKRIVKIKKIMNCRRDFQRNSGLDFQRNHWRNFQQSGRRKFQMNSQNNIKEIFKGFSDQVFTVCRWNSHRTFQINNRKERNERKFNRNRWTNPLNKSWKKFNAQKFQKTLPNELRKKNGLRNWQRNSKTNYNYLW